MPNTYTILDFQRDYKDDDACLQRIMDVRYGLEPTCPSCECPRMFYKLRNRRAYSCGTCGHHIYPCVGTPFARSRTPLWKWFYAMYLFTTSRHGVPAKELERQLGVTYKTAWRMGHAIREAMTRIDVGQLVGEVEVDESYVGGHRPKAFGRSNAHKTIVLGLKQRGGNMHAMVIPDAKTATIEPLIQKHVKAGSTVHTDEWWAYRHLRWLGYDHHAVAHGKGQYVRGRSHTNSIENFWARLKLSIRGTHIHVSRKYLGKYLTEFSFRYNFRDIPDRMFAVLVAAVASP